MNEAIVTTLYFMGSYVGLVLMFFFAMQFLTKGFIGKYLKVKASKGKKLLVWVVSVTDTYFATGEFDGTKFEYTTRGKTTKTFSDVPQGSVFPIMGIFAIKVNEQSDLVYNREDTGKSAADPVATSAIIKRLMMLPPSESKMLIGILLISLVAMVSIWGVGYYMASMPDIIAAKVIAELKTSIGVI